VALYRGLTVIVIYCDTKLINPPHGESCGT